jgi:hypothetical protein
VTKANQRNITIEEKDEKNCVCKLSENPKEILREMNH